MKFMLVGGKFFWECHAGSDKILATADTKRFRSTAKLNNSKERCTIIAMTALADSKLPISTLFFNHDFSCLLTACFHDCLFIASTFGSTLMCN